MIYRLPADAVGISEAAAAIARGELVAFPTETVYGLGANACDNEAVARIYEAKRRPADHPLIVHIAGRELGSEFARNVPVFAARLMEALWPGPLTLILPRKVQVASGSAGGQDSIGLRCPAHAIAQELLHAALERGVLGISAPSANPFGRISPTTAEHVVQGFAGSSSEIYLLDGGACEVGIESSIVDCTRSVPVLLRPGVLGVAELSRVAGQQIHFGDDHAADAPRASGTLAQHYAPRAKLRLMSAQEIQSGLDLLGADAKNLAVYARAKFHTHSQAVLLRRMPDDARSAAHELFAALHLLDASGVPLIWVETPPAASDWDGVRDRLTRASA